METMKSIITKSGQRFEIFSSLAEALSVSKIEDKEGYRTILLIEYEDGKEYIRDGIFTKGEFRETGIKTLLFNPERGVVQMYGNYSITDIDTGEKYSKNKDTPYRLWHASANNHYLFPSYLIAPYIY